MRPCSVPECGRPHRRRGYCDMHSQRVAKYGTPELPPRPPRPECQACGAVIPPRTGAHGLCAKHVARLRRHGDTSDEVAGWESRKARGECGIPGCRQPAGGKGASAGHGWCRRHYRAWYRYGDPLGSALPQGCYRMAPERREAYVRQTAEIRAALRDAMTAHAIGDHTTARRFVEVAESVGRPLTRMERDVVEAIRPTLSERRRSTRERVAELSGEGKSAAQIAAILGISSRQVQRYRATAGVNRERNERVLDMWRAGSGMPEIARALGTNRSVVRGVLRRAGMLSSGSLTATPGSRDDRW